LLFGSPGVVGVVVIWFVLGSVQRPFN